MIQKVKNAAGMVAVGTYLSVLTVLGLGLMVTLYTKDQIKYTIRRIGGK